MPDTKTEALPKIASFPEKNCGYAPAAAAIYAPKQETILQCSQVVAQCRIQRPRPYLKLQAFLRKICGYALTAAAISAPKQEAILQCSQVAAQCRMQMLSQAKSTMHELRLIYKGARLGQPDSSS